MNDPQMNPQEAMTRLNDMSATIDWFYDIGAKVIAEYVERSKQSIEGSPRINNFSQCEILETLILQAGAEAMRLIEGGKDPNQAAGEAMHKALHIYQIIDVHRWPVGVHGIMLTGKEEDVIAEVKERFPDTETLYRYTSPAKKIRTYIIVTRGESIVAAQVTEPA